MIDIDKLESLPKRSKMRPFRAWDERKCYSHGSKLIWNEKKWLCKFIEKCYRKGISFNQAYHIVNIKNKKIGAYSSKELFIEFFNRYSSYRHVRTDYFIGKDFSINKRDIVIRSKKEISSIKEESINSKIDYYKWNYLVTGEILNLLHDIGISDVIIEKILSGYLIPKNWVEKIKRSISNINNTWDYRSVESINKVKKLDRKDKLFIRIENIEEDLLIPGRLIAKEKEEKRKLIRKNKRLMNKLDRATDNEILSRHLRDSSKVKKFQKRVKLMEKRIKREA